MGGLLNDAAGGSRRAVLALRQVGQGHGCIDLPPVRLVSALQLLLLHQSDPSAAPDERETTEESIYPGLQGTLDSIILSLDKCF